MFNQDPEDEHNQELSDSRPRPASKPPLVAQGNYFSAAVPRPLDDLGEQRAADEGFIPQPGEDELPADKKRSI